MRWSIFLVPLRGYVEPQSGNIARAQALGWIFTRNGSRQAATEARLSMHEHLKNRDQVRETTREVLQTFGSLHPKLEHLATTPLPDKSSIIQIVDDLLEVIYPGYFKQIIDNLDDRAFVRQRRCRQMLDH